MKCFPARSTAIWLMLLQVSQPDDSPLNIVVKERANSITKLLFRQRYGIVNYTWKSVFC